LFSTANLLVSKRALVVSKRRRYVQDTRESRWLPTLLCADKNKLLINTALGGAVHVQVSLTQRA
jgi:hypothetical protein